MVAVLQARNHYKMAMRVHEKLGSSTSPGDIQDWDIYWTAGITSLRGIGHTLHHVDRKKSVLNASIIDDFWKNSKFKTFPIFTEFMEKERNLVLKEAESKVRIREITTHIKNKTFEECAAIHGIEKELFMEDGEDALRLYQIALSDWHEHLCIIEQAIKVGVAKPYSSGKELFNDLRNNCNYRTNCPIDYR